MCTHLCFAEQVYRTSSTSWYKLPELLSTSQYLPLGSTWYPILDSESCIWPVKCAQLNWSKFHWAHQAIYWRNWRLLHVIQMIHHKDKRQAAAQLKHGLEAELQAATVEITRHSTGTSKKEMLLLQHADPSATLRLLRRLLLDPCTARQT